MEELLATNQFNTIYEKLFTTFMNGLLKNYKRVSYKFSFKEKVISGRAILPEVKINLEEARMRSLELFRYEYPETKFYSNPLILQMFPDVFDELLEAITKENFLSEAETAVDKLVDEILAKKL
jgi:hypothetical protein